MKKFARKITVFVILSALFITYLPLVSSASSGNEWDGKAALQSGFSYTISNEIKLSSDLTIPENVILTIETGGKLILDGNMKLILRGQLVVKYESELEIIDANVQIRKGGELRVLGVVTQYEDTIIDVYNDAVFLIRSRGELISSGAVNLFSASLLNVAGTITQTPDGALTISGTLECTAQNSVRGAVIVGGETFVTIGGTFTCFGDFLVSQGGLVINSGSLTLGGGSRYTKEGTLRNTKDSIFINDSESEAPPPPHPYAKMTSALLENEPRVEIVGIDVSHWQGTIDWERVARTNIEFVMIRAARGHHSTNYPMAEDTRFREYIAGAQENGLDVGVYFYSYARSVEEVKVEAEFFLSVIKGYELTYPVVFDIEEDFHQRMSKELISEITDAFMEIIMKAGYYPMLYSNKYFLDNVFDQRIPDTYAIWLAQWSSRPTYQGAPFHIWQYTAKGSVPGINGDVDLNVSYIDFPEVLRRNGLNNLK